MKPHRIGTIISLLLLPQTAALAQPRYAFINIADTTGQFADFANWRGPAINDSGTVAFFANLDGGGWGVFTGDGETITTIADERVVFPFEQQPSINDAGDVAFQGGFYRALPVPVGDITSIMVGNGGPLTTVAAKGDQYSFLGKPSISDNGSVAFSASFKTGLSGLFISKDGVIDTIADNLRFSSIPLPFPPSINASGTVGFRAGSVVYAGDGLTPLIRISEPNIMYEVEDYEPTIDDRGVVTFAINDHQMDGIELLAGDGGPTEEVGVVETEIFVSNSNGDVAHLGVPGILTFGPSGNHTVIRHRDPLFGSTVDILQFYRGFNNRGDVVFTYLLANGVQGIAVARLIPEPATAMLVSVALAAVALRRRHRG